MESVHKFRGGIILYRVYIYIYIYILYIWYMVFVSFLDSSPFSAKYFLLSFVRSFLNGLLFLISMVLMFDKAIKDRQAKMERVASLEVDEVAQAAADGDDWRVFGTMEDFA